MAQFSPEVVEMWTAIHDFRREAHFDCADEAVSSTPVLLRVHPMDVFAHSPELLPSDTEYKSTPHLF